MGNMQVMAYFNNWYVSVNITIRNSDRNSLENVHYLLLDVLFISWAWCSLIIFLTFYECEAYERFEKFVC